MTSRRRGYIAGLIVGTSGSASTAWASSGGTAVLELSWLLLCMAPGVVVVAGVVLLLVSRRERRQELREQEATCPNCRVAMTIVPDDQDDAYLDEASRIEEELGTVQHVLYWCQGCGHRSRSEDSSGLLGPDRCFHCRRATLVEQREVEPAGWFTAGREEIQTICRYCHARRVDLFRLTSSLGRFALGFVSTVKASDYQRHVLTHEEPGDPAKSAHPLPPESERSIEGWPWRR